MSKLTYSHTVFWKNFPNKSSKFESISNKKHAFTENITNFDNACLNNNPSILYTGNQYIRDLEQLKLSQSVVNKLNTNKSSCSIYLAEPLCLYDNVEQYSEYNAGNFYNEFPNNVPISHMRSMELDSIIKFQKNNNLKTIIVYTCEINTKQLEEAYPTLNIFCYDIYIRSMLKYNNYINRKTNIIKYKFISPNWRYAPHRHLIMAYLHKKSGKYSWGFSLQDGSPLQVNWIEIEELSEELFTRLVDNSEELKTMSIDCDITPTTINNIYSTGYPQNKVSDAENPELLLSAMQECFCAVVNESRYAVPFGSFSEKLTKPINVKLPFILCAAPHSLQYIKQLGFKTFDAWWDESYDLEENHTERLLKIFKVIDYIDSKSISELQAMYNDMNGVLNYNCEVFKELKNCKRALK